MTEWEIRTKEIFNYLKIKELDKTWGNWVFDSKRNADDSNESIEYNYTTDQNFYYLSKIPVENIINKNIKVLYKYNKDWFRCDNFTKNHNGLHILYAGCSNTEGVGSNIEDTWSHMLHVKLSNFNDISGYFNLAKGGYGLHKILNNFIFYIKEYGKPDYFFVLAPNVLRGWKWENDTWIYDQHVPYGTDPSRLDEQLLDHRKELPNWFTLMNALEAICNTNNIKFLWTTWDDNETINIVKSELFNDSFFPLPKKIESSIEQYRPGLRLQKDDIRARDGHPGRVIHEIWADHFIKKIKERGWLNV